MKTPIAEILTCFNASRGSSMNHVPSMRGSFFISLLFVCFGLMPAVQAVVPAPDGCYPNYTTAEGCNALNLLTTGAGNTGVGWYSLFSNTDASFNTGVGGGALALNNGDSNTAFGAGALLLNTTGTENTATGTDALVHNDTGNRNDAVGSFALFNNINADDNTAVGWDALLNNDSSGSGLASLNTAVGSGALNDNIDGFSNTALGAGALFHNLTSSLTAVGVDALFSNTTGGGNTAVGASALASNTTGFNNTALGNDALFNNDSTGAGLGINNTAVGAAALSNNTDGSANNAIGNDALGSNTTGSINQALGVNALRNNDSGDANIAIGTASLFNNVSGDSNTAVGQGTGGNIVAGSGNVYIGAGVDGPADESATMRIGNEGTVSACYIAGIIDSVVAGANVHINPATSQLSITASSARFKENIKPMANASQSLFALNPVTFRYKKEFDATGIPQFGLVAEQVAKVNPDLVLLDRDGKPYTVRYEEVNAMLLNEFLKEHRKVQQLEAGLEVVNASLKEQAAQIEKVSAQVQLDKSAARTVASDQ